MRNLEHTLEWPSIDSAPRDRSITAVISLDGGEVIVPTVTFSGGEWRSFSGQIVHPVRWKPWVLANFVQVSGPLN